MAQSPVNLRSLSVYAIPPELLESLQVRSVQAQVPAPPAPEIAPVATSAPLAPASGLGCQTCPSTSFETADEQRAHFKSDWHRYNAKAKLQGKTVTADEWEGINDGERCAQS